MPRLQKPSLVTSSLELKRFRPSSVPPGWYELNHLSSFVGNHRPPGSCASSPEASTMIFSVSSKYASGFGFAIRSITPPATAPIKVPTPGPIIRVPAAAPTPAAFALASLPPIFAKASVLLTLGMP